MPFRYVSSLVLCFSLLASGANAATYMPDGDLVGNIQHYTVAVDDNLYSIARRFDIGIVELLSANPGVDPWMPGEGTDLIITTSHILPNVRSGIVLNMSELRLYYFMGNMVMTFPVGIGRRGWLTPLGTTSVVKKRKNPVWTPPASIREENPDLPDQVPAGPNNPMGLFALNLGWMNYAIHGTNHPYGIGKRSSHGCIRLYPEDIETLFNAVSVGTPVTVIDTPYTLGWQGDILYLEVNPTSAQADTIAVYRRPKPAKMPHLHEAVSEFAGPDVKIDWDVVDDAVLYHDGIPREIGKRPSFLHLMNGLF